MRARHRAGHGNHAGANIGFKVAHDLVGQTLARLQVFDLDRRPKDSLAFEVQFCRIDDLGIGQGTFEFLNAAFDEALALTRGIVFRIFGQVTVRTRLGAKRESYPRRTEPRSGWCLVDATRWVVQGQDAGSARIE